MGTSRHADTRRRRRAITLEDRDFIRGAAAWTATTDVSAIDPGLSPDEALQRAPEFLRGLREGKISPAEARSNDASIDVLHAACRLLAEPNAGGVENPLDTAKALYDFIENVGWAGPDFNEKTDLSSDCAFAAWRVSRHIGKASDESRWLREFLRAGGRRESGDFCAKAILGAEVSDEEWLENALMLAGPGVLLLVVDRLWQEVEAAPSSAYNQIVQTYRLLERGKVPLRTCLLPGEREYFLGETARAAGGVNRLLGRLDAAREWLDRSERWFGQIANASGCLARVTYHRLAVALEERDFESVTTALPSLIETFERLQLPEEVLKCRFLRGLVLTERDELTEAGVEFRQIIAEARRLGEDVLLAFAYVNLAQIHALLGEVQETTSLAREATRLLKQGRQTTGLPKAHLSIGYLLRSRGEIQAAIEAFRNAQQEFASLGMQTNVIGTQLMIADLLVELGRQSEAEGEIRQALPLIDECKLVPEGFAAMTLLRESLRRQKIDRQALRNLHEHFEQKKF